MTHYIIIAIFVVILAVAVWFTVKHFRGEGGCCGRSTYKVRKKKLDTVICKKIFKVEGMICQHCVNRVMNAVNSIEGASVTIHLKRGEAVISTAREIPDEVICSAIENAGYTVSNIR